MDIPLKKGKTRSEKTIRVEAKYLSIWPIHFSNVHVLCHSVWGLCERISNLIEIAYEIHTQKKYNLLDSFRLVVCTQQLENEKTEETN